MNQNTILKIVATLAISGSIAFADGKKDNKGPDAGKGPDAKAVFAAIDANGDGQITIKELADSKRFKDADKKEVGAAFKSKDLDGDGSISGREFAHTFGKQKGGPGQRDGAKGKGGKGKGDRVGKGDKGGKGGKDGGAKGKKS